MKRLSRLLKISLAAAFCAALVFYLPLRARAVEFDGNVLDLEWYGCARTNLFGDTSLNGITQATARHEHQDAHSRVMFGFTATGQGIIPGSPVGAAFRLGGRDLGSWQEGPGPALLDPSNYDLQGLAFFCVNADNPNENYCTFEIALGCKSEAALAALEALELRLFDAQGVPSRWVAYPIVTAAPVITAKPTTTEKTTTTKATATEKATTTKTTTATPVYTSAPAVYTQAQQQAAAAPPVTIQQTQPGTSRTETIYYTMIYTEPPVQTAAAHPTLWYEPATAAPPCEATLPTLAVPAPQESRPVTRPDTRGTPLLFAGAGGLALLSGALFLHWLRMQRKLRPGPPAAPPDSPP